MYHTTYTHFLHFLICIHILQNFDRGPVIKMSEYSTLEWKPGGENNCQQTDMSNAN